MTTQKLHHTPNKVVRNNLALLVIGLFVPVPTASQDALFVWLGYGWQYTFAFWNEEKDVCIPLGWIMIFVSGIMSLLLS